MAASNSQPMVTLFADVAGSTRLYELLGNERALAAIDQCLGVIRRLAEGHVGRVVKTIGDEIMAVFPDADTALQAASEMQIQISHMPPVGGQKLGVRIGFHYGDVIEDGGDVFGDSVNVAARLSGLAKAGQIITSQETVEALSPVLRRSTRDQDNMTVRGKQTEIRLFEVIWQESDDMTMMSSFQAPMEARMRIIHLGVEYILDNQRTAVTLGREATNDIVLADRRASRIHCKIERRRDKFVLVDQSSNGSFVTIADEPELMLKREELVLRHTGRISFGHSYSTDKTEVVEFIALT